MNAKSIPPINPDALDVEWLQQARLFEAYGEDLANEERELATLTEDRKTLRSRLIREARQGGKDLLGTTVSDSSVEAWYRVQEDWIAISKKVIEAEHRTALAKNRVFAMVQRRQALEHLVSLYRGMYFAGPSEPHDLSKAESSFERNIERFRDDVMRREADDAVASSLKPRKKARRKPNV